MNGPMRIGLIVPSSNTTMETEIPALLRRREASRPERFTVHSSRMAMRNVTAEELARMDQASERCVRELSDARCDVLVYGCLVAIMAAGRGAHLRAEQRLAKIAADEGNPVPVVTSAGALVSAIGGLGARRVALITPYLRPLTGLVVDYLAGHDIEVVDAISLEVADNQAVGALDPRGLVGHVDRLRLDGAEAVVISACVQMPSLAVVGQVEDRLGLPVLSAATATVHEMLAELGLDGAIPGAGRMLA